MSTTPFTPEIALLPLIAFLISAVTSTAGVSGAFLLLPVQILVLGVATPVVTATNLLYNLLATPGGVWRYAREGRMLWGLTGILSLGALPGMCVGYWLRVHHLADFAHFRWIVAAVLLVLGLRMLFEAHGDLRSRKVKPQRPVEGEEGRVEIDPSRPHLAFSYAGEHHEPSRGRLFLLATVVGVVGGVYGIGGGALIAPFLIWFFRLPVHAIAGATLGATFLTSLAGVLLYTLLPAPQGMTTAPDWGVGLLLGIGGLAGSYVGASLQRYAAQGFLKAMLGIVTLIVGVRFLVG